MRKPNVLLPSTVRNYDAVGELEGRPLRDDLIRLAEVHELGEKHGGWSAEQVALYLDASLHALRQIGPNRQAPSRATD